MLILVAEDDPVFRNLLTEILEPAGYRVVMKENGLLAWEYLRASGADLLILDIDMPKMNGFEVLARVRSTPDLREIPVIMFTVKGFSEDQIAGYDFGADDYITKPFDSDLLIAKIGALMRRTSRRGAGE
jgi:DNA-binding response OmpR family regulator